MKKKTAGELLAPAGNLESAITAFKSGADAVYAGFPRFNAREMNKNFSHDDMSRLSEYCKRHGKKYYNTFNTLIKEDELEDYLAAIEEAVALEPDALILQDIGAAEMIRSEFPRQAIHASTQMGIHNSAGILQAEKLGFSRVILEREVTLDEMRTIIANSPVEVEAFVHGALCCSLSGCCLFSSWIGGYSGNRGKCKQPCRRRYFPEDGGTNGFFFSPSDLCMIDQMKPLIEMGVASFKIEGRLKRLDYVSSTVGAYRMMIDAVMEGKEQTVLGEARKMLSRSPGRYWSHGFYDEKNLDKLIQHKRPGVAGRLCGEVLSSDAKGVKVKASGFIKIGDRVRFQSSTGNEMPSFTLLSLKNLSRKGAGNIKSGETALIRTDIEPEKNSRLYITGTAQAVSQEKLEKLPLFQPAESVDLIAHVSLNSVVVKASYNGQILHRAELKGPFEAARSDQFDREKLEKLFRQSSSNRFKAGLFQTEVSGNPFIPASQMKGFRRDFWVELITALESLTPTEQNRSSAVTAGQRIAGIRDSLLTSALEGERRTLSSVMTAKKADFKREVTFLRGQVKGKPVPVLPIASWSENVEASAIEWELPHFLPEGPSLKLPGKIEKLIQLGARRFRITSLYQIKLFSHFKRELRSEMVLTGSFPLPASNSLAAARLLQELDRIQIWPELSKTEIEQMADVLPDSNLEQYGGGYPSLLATRAVIPVEGKIKDARGLPFLIQRDSNRIYHIYSRKKLQTEPVKGLSQFYNAAAGSLKNEDVSSFNFEYKWV